MKAVEVERAAARERQLIFVAEHERALLTKIRAGFSAERADVGLNDAAQLVGTHAHAHGLSFHEAMLALLFVLEHPGYLFHWRRYDLNTYTPTL